MRGKRTSWLIAIAATIAAQAGATEVCATETPQPNVRRHLVNQAAKLFAPDAVNGKSLYFCAHHGLDAQAVVDSVPRRLPDGSDRVRQAACLRLDAGSRTQWDCHLLEYRQIDMVVKLNEAPTRFRVVIAPEASPELARRFVERAVDSSSRVSTQNYCGSPPKDGVETFRSNFLGKPSATENPTFYVDLESAVWHVRRGQSAMSLVVSENGDAEFKCWTVWDDL